MNIKKLRFFTFFFLLISSLISKAQENIISTNSIAEDVLLGSYTPASYEATNKITDPDVISAEINSKVNADSLKSYLEALSTFENRNTGADTLSATTGMGAARTWVYNKFQEISAENENRLVVSYLQFDQSICSMSQHKNVFAVLPGSDISDHGVIILEAHLDSRCDQVCDINCAAHGMEDNGSGTALVIELARVMSKYTYSKTVVFMATTGEEQGLYGAEAFATYADQKNMKIVTVLNNDVIGGISCGKTSSPPSCPSENHIDSTQVRIFSKGGFNSANKQLARYVKLEYQEQLKSQVSIPMTVTIMSAEDRTGRGGDHIPFAQRGYASVRFSSANEHGDASNGVDYTDRQHTSDDILGVDTDNDMILDSFFVDFNYLARNAVINGNAASMIAIGPKTPEFELNNFGLNLEVKITNQQQYSAYRVGVRTINNDWDSVYTITSLVDTIKVTADTFYFVSVASVDSNGVESLFSEELVTDVIAGSKPKRQLKNDVVLFRNHPNPFDEATTISMQINNAGRYKRGFINVMDLTGKVIQKLDFIPKEGINEVLYRHGYGKVGTFIYSLYLDDRMVDSRSMVFAN